MKPPLNIEIEYRRNITKAAAKIRGSFICVLGLCEDLQSEIELGDIIPCHERHSKSETLMDKARDTEDLL